MNLRNIAVAAMIGMALLAGYAMFSQGGAGAQGAKGANARAETLTYSQLLAAANDSRIKSVQVQGDTLTGSTAANLIDAGAGDDRLTGGRASPESFTHGTSQERAAWLRRGYESGDPAVCDTFSAR